MHVRSVQRKAPAAGRLSSLLLFASAAAHGGVLSGTVVESLGGKPLARAIVAIEPVGRHVPGVPTRVLTDAGGRFVFDRLPGGAYLLGVEKRGYLKTKYGQKRWNSPGTPIVVENDGHFAALVQLPKLGVIAGEVLDENRLGMPGMSVTAWRAGTRLKMVAATESDDRGVFRLAGLEPGRYYVRTGARELEDRIGLLPTFAGQTTRAQQARAIDVKVSQEVSGVVIEPLHGRLSTLSVSISGADTATVLLFADTGKREMQAVAGAPAMFDQLAPGEYELLAESKDDPAHPLAAQARISIGREQESAGLTLGAAPTVRARCEDATSGRPMDGRAVSIFVRRLDTFEDAASRRIQCGEPVVLSPGHWELAAAAPADMFVASLRDASPRGTSYEFTLAARETRDVTLRFSRRPATLTGKVELADGQPAIGAPVFLIPVDPDLKSRMGGVRSARSNQEGSYLFSGLAPGRYEVVSSFELMDAGDTEWPAGVGSSITLTEGEKSTLDLKMQELTSMTGG